MKNIRNESDYIIKIGSYIDKNGETQPEKEIRLGELRLDDLQFTEYTTGE